MRVTRQTRSGFTLVEVLVTIALLIFIMFILSASFRLALDLFRTTRAAGVLQDRLRVATDILRRDLAAPHFDGPFQPGLSGPNLSDQRLDKPGWMPPARGFFRLWQAPVATNINSFNPQWTSPFLVPAASTNVINPFETGAAFPVTVADNPMPAPGVWNCHTLLDSDNLPSNRAFTHVLHFTTRLAGDRRGEYFVASNPGGLQTELPAYTTNTVYASRWAEVAYFLVPANSTTQTGLPLFTLYRRVVVVPPGGNGSNDTNRLDLDGLTVPANRMNTAANGMYQTPPNSNYPRPFTWQEMGAPPSLIGQDILMTDVLSFEVRANWTSHATLPDLSDQKVVRPNITVPDPNPINGDFPFDDLPAPLTGPIPNSDPNSSMTRFGVFSRNLNFWYPFSSPNVGNPQIRVFDTWSQNMASLVNQVWDNPDSTSPQSSSSPAGYMAAWVDNGLYPPGPSQFIDQVPLRIRITALQIRLRVWDVKTKQARQVTLVQTM